MPNGLKNWILAVALTLGAVFLIWLWKPEYGIGVFFSLLHADLVIPYWLRIGIGVWHTILLSSIFGGIGLYQLDWVADRAIDIWKFLSEFWKELPTKGKVFTWALSLFLAVMAATRIGIRWSVIILAVCIAVILFDKLWPPKKKVFAEKKVHPPWLLRMRYWALPFFPIDPYFGASLGIAFYKSLGLKKLPSLVMLNLGNALKMVFIAFGWNIVNESTRTWSTNSYVAFVATIVAASVIIFRLMRK